MERSVPETETQIEIVRPAERQHIIECAASRHNSSGIFRFDATVLQLKGNSVKKQPHSELQNGLRNTKGDPNPTR